MKREELKEKIGDKLKTLLGMAYFESDTEDFMHLIDEYTKPKKKTKPLEERKKSFQHYCQEFISVEYKMELVENFVDYWTEHNEGGKKMRFEMAKNQPFNIKRRLATWKRNQKNNNYGTTTKQTRIDAFKDVYKSGEL